jgi:hypothetical protein
MTANITLSASDAPQRSNRVAAALMAATTLVLLILLAKHPVVGPSDSVKESLATLVAMQSLDRWVHGVLIALIGILAYGLTVLSYAFKRMSPYLLVARLVYWFGCASVTVAMLLDGFVAPNIAIRYVASTVADQQIANGLLVLSSIAIQIFTKFGLLLMSLSFVAWSLALGGARQFLAAAIAFISGSASALFIVVNQAPLTPSSLMVIVAAQSLWYLVAATLLWRGQR